MADDELDKLLEAIPSVTPTKTLQWPDVREALFESLEEVAGGLRSKGLVSNAAKAGTNHLTLHVWRPRDDGTAEHLVLFTFVRGDTGSIQAVCDPEHGTITRSIMSLDYASDRVEVRNLLAGWLGPILRA